MMRKDIKEASTIMAGKEYMVPVSKDQSPKTVQYDFKPQQDLMMVAESQVPYGTKDKE